MHPWFVALQAQLEARDADIARLRHDMAAEVSEAAQQVQCLLAAQGRVAELEEQLAAAQRSAEQMEGQVSRGKTCRATWHAKRQVQVPEHKLRAFICCADR